MAGQEIVGIIVLTVNGKEYDCSSISFKRDGGYKLVSSMNKEGEARLITRTTRQRSFTVDVFIPTTGDDTDWENLKDARITIESIDGKRRTTYSGCYVGSVSESYQDGSESKRSLEMFALRKVEENRA